MKPPADIRVIINPASGSRKTARKIPAIIAAFERHLPQRCAFSLTERPGDAHRIAAFAVRDNCAHVVAVGGDGTLNEVVNGMLSAANGSVPAASLGVIRSGSGDGFAASLRLPQALDEQVRIIAECPSRLIDIGSVSARGSGGEWSDRFFINECQVGIGADVVRSTRGLTKRMGGLIGYGLGTVVSIFRSPNADLSLTLDGREEPPVSATGLSIGNGDRTAGGMTLTPGALPDDGVLNLLTIHSLSLPGRLRSFLKIYSGGHIGAPGFSYRALRRCSVSGSLPLQVAADGEMIGVLPCSIVICEGALQVSAPVHFRDKSYEDADYGSAQARV